MLGPDSRVDIMKGRRRELGLPIYGTRQELWTRLAKGEAKAKVDAEHRAELLRRHELQAAG